LIDVGTGAGFPGMVLAIARPRLGVTLLDATRKKVTFLEHVIEELKLENVTAMHGRAEELGQNFVYRGRYDIATARAVSSLPALLELVMPLLKVRGIGLFPKGAEIETELQEARTAAKELGAGQIVDELLPQLGEEHVTRLVFAAKIRETPKRYPRRSGIPAKEPLGRAKQ
jgi:16S rRNA (guanine527-N7)-methyltransferase